MVWNPACANDGCCLCATDKIPSGANSCAANSKLKLTSRPRYSAAFSGASEETFTISSTIFLNSARPGAGMIMVSRRPLTSSVIRRNRPRGFSFKEKTNVLRSIWIRSVFKVSSLLGGLGPWPPKGEYPEDDRSFEIIRFFP